LEKAGLDVKVILIWVVKKSGGGMDWIDMA
jgi:hypothetical protein